MSTNDFPIGDVTNAAAAMREIELLLHQRGIDINKVSFRVDGSQSVMLRDAADQWINVANNEGYTDIRFVLEVVGPASAVEVSLSASTPKTPATDFRPA